MLEAILVYISIAIVLGTIVGIVLNKILDDEGYYFEDQDYYGGDD